MEVREREIEKTRKSEGSQERRRDDKKSKGNKTEEMERETKRVGYADGVGAKVSIAKRTEGKRKVHMSCSLIVYTITLS